MGLGEFFDRLAKLLAWWVVVTPWEQALRVRRGHTIERLGPGVHLRMPVLDMVYKQSVRLRSSGLPVQTLTTRDGRTLTVSVVISYCVADLELLYQTLHHAEDTVRNLALGAIAAFVHDHDGADCTPRAMADEATKLLDLDRFGLGSASMEITDFAFVRTHRLIMDQKWGGHGDSLNTCEAQR